MILSTEYDKIEYGAQESAKKSNLKILSLTAFCHCTTVLLSETIRRPQPKVAKDVWRAFLGYVNTRTSERVSAGLSAGSVVCMPHRQTEALLRGDSSELVRFREDGGERASHR